MNLQKINDNLTKVMIGIFLSIMTLTLIAIILPVLGYVIVVLMYLLMITTLINLGLSTYLMIQQINKMIENFFRNYEQQH